MVAVYKVVPSGGKIKRKKVMMTSIFLLYRLGVSTLLMASLSYRWLEEVIVYSHLDNYTDNTTNHSYVHLDGNFNLHLLIFKKKNISLS